jgi:hypothetical protein
VLSPHASFLAIIGERGRGQPERASSTELLPPSTATPGSAWFTERCFILPPVHFRPVGQASRLPGQARRLPYEAIRPRLRYRSVITCPTLACQHFSLGLPWEPHTQAASTGRVFGPFIPDSEPRSFLFVPPVGARMAERRILLCRCATTFDHRSGNGHRGRVSTECGRAPL